MNRTSFRHALALAPVLALLLAATPSLAATLAGRLTDAETRHPVEGAIVRLLETGQAVRTDADGRFAFTSLAPGAYTVSAHHVALADVERAVRVHASGDAALELVARPAYYRADAIAVRSTRSAAAMRTTPYAADAIERDAIADTPAPTASDAAARLPGVALSRDGTWETAVSVRGLSRANIVALVDDARIETATDLSGGLSLVNPNDLERIEVMKSSGSVLFGSGSLGGGVQMVTRRAEFSDKPRSGFEWTDGVSSADGGNTHYLATEVADSRYALRLSAGDDNAGDVRTPRGRLANSHDAAWSLNGSLGVRTVGAQSLTFLYQRVQAEDTGLPGGSAFTANALVTYTMARRERFGLEYAMPNLAPWLPLVTARMDRQTIERDVNVVQSPVIVLTPHASHVTTSGRLEARMVPAPGHLLVTGAELWHRAVDSERERYLYALGRTVGERPIPLAAYMSGGVYAQDEWNVRPDRARLVAGARYDRGRTHNEQAMNPEYWITSAGLNTHPAGQTVLWPAGTSYDDSWNANAGLHVDATRACALSVLLATAYRSPSLEERYQVLDLGSSLHVGNPDLKPERSVSLDVGATVHAGGTRAEAHAFGNDLKDLVAEVPGTYEGRAAFVKTNIGQARLYGWELDASQRLHAHAGLEASLAYVRGEDTRAHANLPQIAPLTGRADLSLESPHAATLHLTATAAHTQGNPAAGETRTAGWAAWGANVTSAPLRSGGTTLTLRGGVENAFDHAYELHLTTLRGLVKLEPGRNWFVSGTLAF